MDLRDIYGTLHQIQKNIYFFISINASFSKVDHILGHKANINRLKQIEITLSHHHGLNLDINNNRKNRKLTKSWKLSNSVMNGKWVKAEITERY